MGRWQGEVRAEVCAHLDGRRPQMEEAILARIVGAPRLAGSEEGGHPSRLKKAVSAGVSHGIAGIERREDLPVQIPAALFTQTRAAVRNGIPLDAVLCGCFAGYTVFCDFVMRAVEESVSPQGPSLRMLLHSEAMLFERLLVAVAEEYTRESLSRRGLPEGRQFEHVKKLLAGESVETAYLAYEFDDWHVGVIAQGDGAVSALRDLAEATDRRLLLVRPDRGTAWAWFGGRRRIAVAEIADRVSLDGRKDALVALGEPARGIEGWRLTHQQATAAFSVARPGVESVVRYADVGLLASIAQDHVLARSLHELYIAPLAGARDGGAGFRRTLRAYFAAGRNVSSAASALGVSRQTVSNRLRAIEEKLGRTLESCAPEVEVALRLEGIGDVTHIQPLAPSAPSRSVHY